MPNDVAAPRVTPPPGATLERRLGPLDAVAVVVSNVIGGGIFFVPILVVQRVPNARAAMLVWLVGGLLAFAGALAYAELAALRPRAGGEYVYLREAFGPLAAFLSGWTSFVAGFSGAIAASAVALADYLGRFVPGAADATPLLTLPIAQFVISRRTLVALATIGVLTWVHLRGLGRGRVLQNVLAGAKVSALVVFIATGFAIGRGDIGQVVTGAGPVTSAGFMGALIPVMFAYSGWNAATYLAEEVRAPGRNLPIALGLGTLAVVLIYLGLNALFLFALPINELAAVRGALGNTVAERLLGVAVAGPVAAFTVVSLAASISAMVLAGPRVYFAMARDGVFMPSAGSVHSRFHTPVVAILAQSAWSAVLVLSGTLAQLVSYTGFTIVLFSAVAVVSLFVLRGRQDGARPSFRAWGYPWAPALFVVVSAVILINEVWRNPGPSIAGLTVIASGIPVYWWRARWPAASRGTGHA